MAQSVVMTLVGPDRPGLVDTVASVISSHEGNWLESRMAHLGGHFAGVLRVEVPQGKLAALLHSLHALEARGLHFQIQAETPGTTTAPARRRVVLDLVGQDRPGIVRDISAALARHHANVEELETECLDAPHAGGKLFTAKANITLRPDGDLHALQDELERIASDLMVEIHVDDPAED